MPYMILNIEVKGTWSLRSKGTPSPCKGQSSITSPVTNASRFLEGAYCRVPHSVWGHEKVLTIRKEMVDES